MPRQLIASVIRPAFGRQLPATVARLSSIRYRTISTDSSSSLYRTAVAARTNRRSVAKVFRPSSGRRPYSTTDEMSPASTQPLFVVDIPPPPSSSSTQSAGSFVCTQPAPQVYLLSFSAPPDNRLTPAFNSAFVLALDIIEHRLPRGVVITTSSIAKFYSNGLDYENAIKDPNFMSGSLFPLWRRLITFPMPTVALINGHAFAGGFMTAMMHDYRFMNPHKGFLCLNELDFGAVLQPPMASVFRVKLNMSTFREMILEGRRYPALDALKQGLVDGVGGLDETMAYINEMKLTQKAQGTSYGKIKEELYREVMKDLDEGGKLKEYHAAKDSDRKRRDDEAKKRADGFKGAIQVRSKL